MKKIFWIVGGSLILLLAVAGGFYAGMTYQANMVTQAQANFERVRGSFDEGQLALESVSQFRQAGSPTGFVPGMRGGGLSGQVKSFDGNVLIISTAEDVTTVNLSENTQVMKNVVVPLDELQPGTRVLVTGETGSNGEIDAVQIMVLDEASIPFSNDANPPGEPPAERQP